MYHAHKAMHHYYNQYMSPCNTQKPGQNTKESKQCKQDTMQVKINGSIHRMQGNIKYGSM